MDHVDPGAAGGIPYFLVPLFQGENGDCVDTTVGGDWNIGEMDGVMVLMMVNHDNNHWLWFGT